MRFKFILYILVGMAVIWAMDSLNINQFFKKNKVHQARLLYFFITVALIYLVTNFLYDLYICLN